MASPMARPLSRPSVARITACQAQQDEKVRSAVALPLASMAAMVAAAMIAGAFVPEEALAARSSGRAGGSSGFSARRAAPAPSA